MLLPYDVPCMTNIAFRLYGLVLHQAYRYARMFPADTLFIRLLVRVPPSFESPTILIRFTVKVIAVV